MGFLSGFAIDAKGSHRPGLEPRGADLFPAFFAQPVAPVFDPLQGFVDLAHELSFAILDPQHEVSVRLERSTVGRIGNVFLVVHHAIDGALRFAQELGPALGEKLAKELEIPLVHKRSYVITKT